MSTIIGIGVAIFSERVRVLNGLRSKVMLISEEVEKSIEDEGRDAGHETSIEHVWRRALVDLRQTVFAALPYLILGGERERVSACWRTLRDFDMSVFYDNGMTLLADRYIFEQEVMTKKEALLGALRRLEMSIG